MSRLCNVGSSFPHSTAAGLGKPSETGLMRLQAAIHITETAFKGHQASLSLEPLFRYPLIRKQIPTAGKGLPRNPTGVAMYNGPRGMNPKHDLIKSDRTSPRVANAPGRWCRELTAIYFQATAWSPGLTLLPSLPTLMLSVSPLGAVFLVIAVCLYLVHRRRRNSRLPYPPGPKGYPMVGNVFDVPQDVPVWKTAMSIGGNYSEWMNIVGIRWTDIGVRRLRCGLPKLLGHR